MDLQKQTFKLFWMCLFGPASSQLLGFAQWQTRCIQIVHCSPQSRRFWKCEHFLLAKSCQHVSDIIIALTSVGRRRPWRLQWQIAVAAAVALWQIAVGCGAVADCSCCAMQLWQLWHLWLGCSERIWKQRKQRHHTQYVQTCL